MGVLDVVARFRVRNMSGYVTVYYSFADTADTAEQVGCDWSPGQPVLTPDWSSRTPWWSWSAPTPTPGSRRADSSSPSTEEDLAGDPPNISSIEMSVEMGSVKAEPRAEHSSVPRLSRLRPSKMESSGQCFRAFAETLIDSICTK